ncbi:MAG: NAD(P)/FAD-dependent oxidoreductase, partial [Bacteroidia bacterium]
YEIFETKKKFSECDDQMDYLNKHIGKVIGKRIVYQNADAEIKKFGFRNVRHMILNTAESQIDTGKMITALIAKVRNLGVEIINGFDVQELIDHEKNVEIRSSPAIKITCKRVIIATNGFAKQLLPNYSVVPARAQVLITQPIKNLKIKGTFHYDSGFYYFRNVGNRVLFGGGRNLDLLTEETTEFGLTQLVQNKLEELLKTMILPSVKYSIDTRWSGIMGVGPSKKSIIRAVSTNVFCAVRMGGMGVAIGSLVGEEVAAMVTETL